ncbi:MAG TPA: redoxin domain-containing protein [Blastocatellia bacterium]|nr:redoxin domain-containing protein [Blastocatellia bacterium]
MSKGKNQHGTTSPGSALEPGVPAPDFKLRSTQSIQPDRETAAPDLDKPKSLPPDQFLSLSELRGRPVILVFYPADWSPVCGDEVVLYNELLPEFQRFNAAVLGISVDSLWSHMAFAEDRKLRFPLLSDFEPKGEVARSYGAYRRQDGISERALFVIDAEGKIRWSYISPIDVNPGAEGILDTLEALDSKRKAAV